MNKRKIGKEKEAQAVLYLQKHGYEVLEQNYWCLFAELDIVAKEQGVLCFIEVKYRSSDRYGGSEGVISPKKIQHICRAADHYIMENRIFPDTAMRFDVLFIIGEDVTLIKDAFPYRGK